MNVVFFGFKRRGLVYLNEQQAAQLAGVTVNANDVLLNITGASIGRVSIAPPDMAGARVNQHVCIVRPNAAVDPRFLAAYLSAPVIQDQIASDNFGVTRQALTKQQILDLDVPVPPRPEQTRIADQLDTLLARVNACNGHLDAIPGILKRFRQAVLRIATSGSLTADQRPDGGCASKRMQLGEDAIHIPSTWKATDLQGVLDPSRPLCYGVVQPGGEGADGVPLIRVQDMSDGTVASDQLRTISLEVDKEYRRSRVLGGEVLISVVGTIGRTAIVPDRLKANIARAVARVACSEGVCNRWVYYWLSTESLQWHLVRSSKEVARKTLNLSDLARVPIGLPSWEEQKLIVSRVERLFAVADRIEARYTSLRAHAHRLAPQVLAKAFRGELVEQDPQDEPASVLLQRLAASQPAKASVSRGRPRAQPKPHSSAPDHQPDDWAALPDGAWAAPADPDGHATSVWLTAVLRAWGAPMPERTARLATLLCQKPHLFFPALPAAQASMWSRLVGDAAVPLPAQVIRLQPVSNHPWGRALQGMRMRGDLVEAGTGDDVTWALGPGAAGIATAGWPDGRAGFVVAHLRAHGLASILPALAPAEQAFVDARAA